MSRIKLVMLIIVLCVSAFLVPSTGWAKTHANKIAFKDVVIPQDNVVDNVVVIGNDLRIAGTVKDVIVVIRGNLTIEKTASIEEDVIVLGGNVYQEEGAVLKESVFAIGPQIENLVALVLAGFMLLMYGFVKLLATIAMIIVPAVFAWGAKGKMPLLRGIAEQRVVKNLVLGALGCLAVFIVSALFVVSVIGIPLALLVGIVSILAVLFGLSGLCAAIGEKIAYKIGAADRPVFIHTLYGAIAIALLSNLPFVGVFVAFSSLLYGMGVIMMMLFKK